MCLFIFQPCTTCITLQAVPDTSKYHEVYRVTSPYPPPPRKGQEALAGVCGFLTSTVNAQFSVHYFNTMVSNCAY